MTVGERVRTLLELVADDGAVIPAGTLGTDIGFAGDRFVVEFEERDTDTRRTVTAERWEVRR